MGMVPAATVSLPVTGFAGATALVLAASGLPVPSAMLLPPVGGGVAVLVAGYLGGAALLAPVLRRLPVRAHRVALSTVESPR
jgi:hypothetical protein